LTVVEVSSKLADSSSLSALSVLGRFCPRRDFLAGARHRTHFDPEGVVG
jgi:hypothetical protein